MFIAPFADGGTHTLSLHRRYPQRPVACCDKDASSLAMAELTLYPVRTYGATSYKATISPIPTPSTLVATSHPVCLTSRATWMGHHLCSRVPGRAGEHTCAAIRVTGCLVYVTSHTNREVPPSSALRPLASLLLEALMSLTDGAVRLASRPRRTARPLWLVDVR